MKSYLIIDYTEDNIIPLYSWGNILNNKISLKFKPLGDTLSFLNISLNFEKLSEFKNKFNTSWNKSLCIVNTNGNDFICVQYYNSKIIEERINLNLGIADIEIHSDYHEVRPEDEKFKMIFKSWELQYKLNQLGI
jgi:hypothetical protein